MTRSAKILVLVLVLLIGIILESVTGGRLGLVHQPISALEFLKNFYFSVFWVVMAWCIGFVRFDWPGKT